MLGTCPFLLVVVLICTVYGSNAYDQSDAEPVWVLSGDCSVDPNETHCITSSGFPDAFRGLGNCTMQFQKGVARSLDISSCESDDDANVFKIVGTYCTYSKYSVGALNGALMHWPLAWFSTNETGTARWKICASEPSSEDDVTNSTSNETSSAPMVCPGNTGVGAPPPAPLLPQEDTSGSSASIYEEGKKLSTSPLWCITGVALVLVVLACWLWQQYSRKHDVGIFFSKRKARSAQQIPIVFTFSAPLSTINASHLTTPSRVSPREAAAFYRCGECRTVAEVVGALRSTTPVRYACPSCATVNELSTRVDYPVEEP